MKLAEQIAHVRSAAFLLVFAGLIANNGPGSASAPASEALRARAFELAYNLDHEDALATFRKAIAADPSDPAAYRGVAAVTWLNITVFERGSASIDDFLGRFTRPTLKLQPPSPQKARVFHEHVGRALALAEKRLAANPRDPDAYYQLGATVAVMTSYQAVIEGRIVGAFRSARRAYSAHEEVLRLDPRRKDAALVVGSYRYAISTLSMPMRWMAYVAGFGGGRDRGLRLIEEAASYPGETQPEARLLLVLLYNRERKFDAALRLLGELQRQYPRNRLLWLNEGTTALRAGQHARADEVLSRGIAMLASDRRPRAFGEEALWRYKRGAARSALGRRHQALEDFHTVLRTEARNWVRGRAHLELGKLADQSGDRAGARAQYEKSIALCQSDNDPEGVNLAERLRKGYRR